MLYFEFNRRGGKEKYIQMTEEAFNVAYKKHVFEAVPIKNKTEKIEEIQDFWDRITEEAKLNEEIRTG